MKVINMQNDKSVYRLQGLSCANCAAKFEKNIEAIESVEAVQVNFGAAKLTVDGEVSIEQLEQAGAFDGIKVLPERQRHIEEKEPFWKKRHNLTAMISVFFIVIGYLLYFQVGQDHPLTVITFLVAILIGGFDLFKVGLKNLTRLVFDMNTLMTFAIIGSAYICYCAVVAVVVYLVATISVV